MRKFEKNLLVTFNPHLVKENDKLNLPLDVNLDGTFIVMDAPVKSSRMHVRNIYNLWKVALKVTEGGKIEIDSRIGTKVFTAAYRNLVKVTV